MIAGEGLHHGDSEQGGAEGTEGRCTLRYLRCLLFRTSRVFATTLHSNSQDPM